ncbi:hypothetical protein RO3G_13312 [Rhizopus delemar RA 99-880]|uniref:Uncharacterized protein n=1 Tax=Rhizopus delemar (strain RA 99-880 / ATCC MYA-4621 / FGSC 9543 / NRRL 43880) TaxID=246409 RepID=I1CJH1_RHIO9|nr:hypothetical protein RO3G_13312 [Rhizopus delemar RA 99-880]|eukprot:EIE88601.1 hypothetical protein RO3G_13312 [Rhizopus delemar RA 99-880]
MSCPQAYFNKNIEIKASVENREFFSRNFVNKWTFRDYLIWTGDTSLGSIKTHYRNYKNSLISLSKRQGMDRDLCIYVANLMKKSSDLELKQLREELNEKPDDTVEGSVNIINSVVTDSNIISAQSNSAVSVKPPKRIRESLPSTGE